MSEHGFPIDSIDGVEYHAGWSDGEMYIEPGHIRVVNAYEFYGKMLYFTERGIYRGPVIATGNQAIEGEASGGTRSEAP